MIPILILAAGQSSRMRGADKLLEPVDGMPLIRQRALTALAASPVVFIALPAVDHPRADRVADLPVTLIAVPDAGGGMAVSLRIGVASLPKCNHFMVLLADMPEITKDDLCHMLALLDADHLIWRGSDATNTPGHPIIFGASLRSDFADLTGDMGARAIIARNATRTRLVRLPGRHATCDLDTPEQWADWRRETGR